MDRFTERLIWTLACLPAVLAATPWAAEEAATPLVEGRGGAFNRPAVYPDEVRSIDGSGNNLFQDERGRAETPLLRITTNDYGDGVDTPAGATRHSARTISNICAAQSGPILNNMGASDFVWQWGQFLDHDLDLTESADPAEPFDIDVPLGDSYFDPTSTGSETIPLNRSAYVTPFGVREQVNQITAYIDGSNIYGSDATRAAALRVFTGGLLNTSAGDLLPFNSGGLPNAGGTSASLFLAGDIRANEQVGLTCMHTLFVREHNYWAAYFEDQNPTLTDDELYERARAVVIGELQRITYSEFLPVLLGAGALPDYQGYDPNVDASIANAFSTAAYRLGHSMLSPQLQRLDENGETIGDGHIDLRDAFFNPDAVSDYGIDVYLRGLAHQQAQEIDAFVIDDVRNFLFGPPGSGGFDLASLNIQRGRDHGLPSFNQARIDYGLASKTSLDEVTTGSPTRENLGGVYGSPDDMDLWVGGLCEDHVIGGMVGETFRAILVDQFTRLRDGDRFWYQSYLPSDLLAIVESQTLADVIRRNTAIGDEIPDNVFIVPAWQTPDRDMDGVPTDFEELAGSDPDNASDMPGDGNLRDLAPTRLKIKLVFKKTGRDTIQLKGALTLPAAVDTEGAGALVYIGGVLHAFVLDARGRGHDGDHAFKLRQKKSSGGPVAATVLLKYKRGDFADAFLDEGMTDATVPKPGDQVSVQTLILLGDTYLYQNTMDMTYTAKASNTGVAIGR